MRPHLTKPVAPEAEAYVVARDAHACVLCGVPAARAYPIFSPALFDDDGAAPGNLATLCDPCAGRLTRTELYPHDVQRAASIADPTLPPGYGPQDALDHWGNVVLPNGLRMRGPLFDDPDVQAALEQSGMLSSFTPFARYPSTPHLPWSANVTSGTARRDRILRDVTHFEGWEVVVTEKMDGENTTIYHGGMTHARSPNGGSHPSRDWVKGLAARIGWELPEGWRLSGENLYAQHSVAYEDLASYFLLFGVWDEHNRLLSWDDTVEWASLLGLRTVPLLYRGPWSEPQLRALAEAIDTERSEGFVVRVADAFPYAGFARHVAKWVRPHHVQTDAHWMRQAVKVNGLA